MPWYVLALYNDRQKDSEISFFKSGRLRDGGCENLEWQI